MPSLRRHARAALLSGALASTVACGGDGGPGTGSSVAPNRMRWSMPLDSFGTIDTVALRDFARFELAAGCLEERGLPTPPHRDPAERRRGTDTFNDQVRRIFTRAVAAEYGYHLDPGHGTDSTSAHPAELTSPDGQAALEICMGEADSRLPQQPDTSLLQSLHIAAWESAFHDDAVLEAATEWRACMEPAGIHDLPERPEDMPPRSLASRFGLGDESEGGLPIDPPSGREEIELAMQDAECRESSSYGQTLYDTEWAVQSDLLAENEDALERLRAESEQFEHDVRAALREHS